MSPLVNVCGEHTGHHWEVTIVRSPSLGPSYHHVCKRCGRTKDIPMHKADSTSRWRPTGKKTPPRSDP